MANKVTANELVLALLFVQLNDTKIEPAALVKGLLVLVEKKGLMELLPQVLEKLKSASENHRTIRIPAEILAKVKGSFDTKSEFIKDESLLGGMEIISAKRIIRNSIKSRLNLLAIKLTSHV